MENLIVSYFNIYESRIFREEQSRINTIFNQRYNELQQFEAYSFYHKI